MSRGGLWLPPDQSRVFLLFLKITCLSATVIAVFVFTVMAVTSTCQIEPLEEWMDGMNKGQPTAGERGCVITPMSPSGKVLIDGVQYSARLKSDFADSGDEVVVVGLDAFGLIVTKPESPAQESDESS